MTRRKAVALALASLFAVNTSGLIQAARPALRTEDRNHDGRPDVWRWYDVDGRLARLEIDANFDGRPDWREEYRDNRPFRREVDTNFDNRTDAVVEFDPETQEPVREEIDTNLNGTADVLRLYEHGRLAFVEHAAADDEAVAPARADTPFQPFSDPFRNDLAARSANGKPQPIVAVLDSTGLPPKPARTGTDNDSRPVRRDQPRRGHAPQRNSTPLRGPPLTRSL